MARNDPYQPEPPYEYECADCNARVRAEQHPGTCDECGGELRDLAVPRE